MAFFGLPDSELPRIGPDEDLAVYTWGEDSYDGLGDALQEGGDDLNHETFGSVGAVGKDFDFSSAGLPDNHQSQNRLQALESRGQTHNTSVRPNQTNRSLHTNSLESIWDDNSTFSVLPRPNGSNRIQPRVSPTTSSSRFSPFENQPPPAASARSQQHQQQQRARTLQDIETEMLARAEQDRKLERDQQLFAQLHQLEKQEQFQRTREQEFLTLAQQQQLYDQQRQPRLQDEELQLRRQQQQLYQQEQDEERQLRRHQQQEQQQAQLHRLTQQREQLYQRTPPPRMIPTSQSPRFLEHQRQLLLLQQQQHLQDLQEQLRIEELERRMAAQMTLERNRNGSPFNPRRTPTKYTAAEVQAAQLFQQQQQQQQQLLQQQQQQQHRRQGSRSPAISASQFSTPLQEGLSYHPQNIQLQQRLLADLAQVDFSRELHGASPAEQEALRMEAIRKIVETEKMEEKRRRKAAKIAHMARYNDLMTQSDKDFITRIQVSQLVTQDPYADDFYAQVYGAILRSRLGLQSQDERVLKFGSGGGIGLGLASKGGSRRPSAMQRMEQQVERIVSNARKREEEKGLHAIHSLQGALGKTSGRSYKAAPRQLLQVDAGPGSPTLSPMHSHVHASKAAARHEGAAREAAKLGREALGDAADTDNLVRKEPLSHRQVLVILEELYDIVLQVEQLRRDQPPQDEIDALLEWEREYEALVQRSWDELRVMVPLQTSDPHPFVSLLTPTKGKKILPRLTRHLNSQRMLTLLTLLVACFSQLDVVHQAPCLDSIKDTQERSDVERQTQAFLGSVMQSILPVVSVANLRLVTGLLGLLLDRSNVVAVAQTRPGLALLTLFLSRVEVIKQTIATSPDVVDTPSLEESQQWRLMFDHLFQLLAPHLLLLFPSTRIHKPESANNQIQTDVVDQPVWQFLAALALHAVVEQHHILVSTLREKILDNVLSVNKGWVHDEDERQTKLANVNLFLHALNLDSSQIAM